LSWEQPLPPEYAFNIKGVSIRTQDLIVKAWFSLEKIESNNGFEKYLTILELQVQSMKFGPY
jgi:hypothetical protein